MSKLLVNTTFVVSTGAEAAFLRRVRRDWLPSLAAAGFSDGLLCRILTPGEPGTHSYAVQFRASSRPAAKGWLDTDGARIIGMLQAECGTENMLHFTTYMGILDTND